MSFIVVLWRLAPTWKHRRNEPCQVKAALSSLLWVTQHRDIAPNPRTSTAAQVGIWDHERSEPVTELSWGSDTVTSVRFNPAEADLLASAGSDRSIALYDLRSSTPIRKIIMQVGRHHAVVAVLQPQC